MEFIYNKIFLKHEKSKHPENPERLAYFDKHLKETKIENGEKYLKLVYNQDYIRLIKEHSEKESYLDADTYTNKYSYEAACYAVGAAILAAKENNFSLARPPGHHGNGTQDIFYSTNKVLYLSMHQFPAYPGTGWLEEIGQGKGEGFTVNIPLPPCTADDLFLGSLNTLMPMIKEQFNPDVVAVSAGFDGHHSDPLLELNLTTNAYYNIGKLLSNNFSNIFACLEGGYNLEFLHKNIIDFVNGINNKSQEFKEESTISEND